MRTIYDLTGLEGFESLLNPLQLQYPFVVENADTLARQNVEALSGQWVILSDERFGNKSDEEILIYLQQLSQTGLSLRYIGVPRNDPTFEKQLHDIQVQTYLVDVLTEEGVSQWLSEQLQTWYENAEEETKEVSNSLEEPQNEVQEIYVDDKTSVKPIREDNMCIVISGAPGVGATFVGVNLATALADKREVNYVEAAMRPCLTTWLGAEETEVQSTLSVPMHSAFHRGNLNVFTRNPFGDEQVHLRDVAKEIAAWRDPTVLDLSLQDYLSSLDHPFASSTIRILVTTGDIHRCRYLEGIQADIVVINQAPDPLPVDEQEYQVFWPDATLVFVPYEPQQGIAIIQGQATAQISEAVSKVMGNLLERLERRNLV